MEEHTGGDEVQGLEQKSRREDMVGRVEELRCEVMDGGDVEAVQPDGDEPQGEEGEGSAESKREETMSDAPDDITSGDDGPRVEDSGSDEPEGDNTKDMQDEPHEVETKGREPESNDPKGGQADVAGAADDDPPKDDHFKDDQSPSEPGRTSESQESTPSSPQSTLADSDEDRRALEHCAPEVVEEPPLQEKKLDMLASPEHTFAETADDLPSHCRQHRHNGLFWSPPSPLLEPVPVYPGDPTDYPQVVDKPMELEASAERPFEELICGLRKRQFLLIFGIVTLIVVVVAVSVGVGVAYGTRRKSTSTTTSLTPWPLKPCDATHNTTFATKNGKIFQRLCFLDYGGTMAEATDLTSTRTPSMEECMKACSELDDCTGAGWGPPNGVNTYRTTCWMKKNLKRPHVATADFEFAVLISGNVTVPSMEPYF